MSLHREVVAEHGAVVVGRHLEAHDGAAVGVDRRRGAASPPPRRRAADTSTPSAPGWPALVSTRYMSPTVRSSCWNVATFFESGDHSTIGARRCSSSRRCRWRSRSSSTPSVVSGRSTFEARSRTQRFQSLMNTARVPSGETTALRVRCGAHATVQAGALDVAGVALLADVERHRRAVGRELDGLERAASSRRPWCAGGRGQRRGQPLVVERAARASSSRDRPA